MNIGRLSWNFVFFYGDIIFISYLIWRIIYLDIGVFIVNFYIFDKIVVYVVVGGV